MKEGFHISINQFAEFASATSKGKMRILQQQVTPNKFLVPWYQSAKGSFKRYFTDVNNFQPLLEGIKKVEEKKPENKRQTSDKTVSLQALKKMLELQLQLYFNDLSYEAIKPEIKSISILNVSLGITPDLIFKTTIEGRIAYGGIKVHISKDKPVSLNQCQFVSTVLMQYIQKNIAKSGEIVLPHLCLCIDVFGERVVSAKEAGKKSLNEVKTICEEIKTIWPKKQIINL